METALEKPPNSRRRAASPALSAIALRLELGREMRRAGVSPEKLSGGHPNLGAWIAETPTQISREELERALKLWRALPDRPRTQAHDLEPDPEPSGPERITLTPKRRARLRAHWMRVGLSIPAFVKGLKDPPSGLTSGMITAWIGDDAPKTVRKDQFEFAMAAWAKLPDGLGRLKRTHFVPVGSAAASE